MLCLTTRCLHTLLYLGVWIRPMILNLLGVCLVCLNAVVSVWLGRLGMRVNGEHERDFGTLLRSNRESALFSDLNFLTWNCRKKGQNEWAAATCLYSPLRHTRLSDHDITQLSNNIFWQLAPLKRTKRQEELQPAVWHIWFSPNVWINISICTQSALSPFQWHLSVSESIIFTSLPSFLVSINPLINEGFCF